MMACDSQSLYFVRRITLTHVEQTHFHYMGRPGGQAARRPGSKAARRPGGHACCSKSSEPVEKACEGNQREALTPQNSLQSFIGEIEVTRLSSDPYISMHIYIYIYVYIYIYIYIHIIHTYTYIYI